MERLRGDFRQSLGSGRGPRPWARSDAGSRGLDAPDSGPDRLDPDRAVVAPVRGEAAHAGAGQERRADVLLGVVRTPPVEPLIEVEVEGLLRERDLREPGRGEQIDDLAAGGAPRVRSV